MRTRITKGTVTTIEAAMISPQGNSRGSTPLNCEITTGTVFVRSSVKVRAKRNSFQAAMKASKPAETKPGMVSGRRISQKTFNGEAPSTYAASSSSLGKLRKY